MVSTIRYSANASSDHHPNQVPGILIIMNPKQPNLPTCSVTSTYLLFHLLSNPSLHLIDKYNIGYHNDCNKNQPKNIKPFHIIYHHKLRFSQFSKLEVITFCIVCFLKMTITTTSTKNNPQCNIYKKCRQNIFKQAHS